MNLRKTAIYILSTGMAWCALAASPQSTAAGSAPQAASSQPQSLADYARKNRKKQTSGQSSSHKVFTNDSFTGRGAPRPAGTTSSRTARKSHAKTAKKGKDPFQPQH